MSINRYGPFDLVVPRTMREAMDRLLEQSLTPTWATDFLEAGRGFPIDIYEDEPGYIVEVSLPGIKPEELKVTATANSVTIRAHTAYGDKREEKKAEPKGGNGSKEKAGTYLRRERYTGEVVRVIDLPEPISPDKIRATYKHGVLTLEVPKAGEVKPRKIEIALQE